jgi:hypothetical protein
MLGRNVSSTSVREAGASTSVATFLGMLFSAPTDCPPSCVFIRAAVCDDSRGVAAALVGDPNPADAHHVRRAEACVIGYVAVAVDVCCALRLCSPVLILFHSLRNDEGNPNLEELRGTPRLFSLCR